MEPDSSEVQSEKKDKRVLHISDNLQKLKENLTHLAIEIRFLKEDLVWLPNADTLTESELCSVVDNINKIWTLVQDVLICIEQEMEELENTMRELENVLDEENKKMEMKMEKRDCEYLLKDCSKKLGEKCDCFRRLLDKEADRIIAQQSMTTYLSEMPDVKELEFLNTNSEQQKSNYMKHKINEMFTRKDITEFHNIPDFLTEYFENPLEDVFGELKQTDMTNVYTAKTTLPEKSDSENSFDFAAHLMNLDSTHSFGSDTQYSEEASINSFESESDSENFTVNFKKLDMVNRIFQRRFHNLGKLLNLGRKFRLKGIQQKLFHFTYDSADLSSQQTDTFVMKTYKYSLPDSKYFEQNIGQNEFSIPEIFKGGHSELTSQNFFEKSCQKIKPQPSYKQIKAENNREFTVSYTEHTSFFLKEVKRKQKILEELFSYCQKLQELSQMKPKVISGTRYTIEDLEEAINYKKRESPPDVKIESDPECQVYMQERPAEITDDEVFQKKILSLKEALMNDINQNKSLKFSEVFPDDPDILAAENEVYGFNVDPTTNPEEDQKLMDMLIALFKEQEAELKKKEQEKKDTLSQKVQQN